MEQLPNHSDKADPTGEAKSSSLMLIAESLGAYFGKLPVALQKNVTKALGHLLGVPMAYLDGIASELKAASAARVKITEATGDKLAKSIKVDGELADIALATHANKILRHQKNSIKVLKYAAAEMESIQGQNRVEPVLSSEQEKEQAEPKEISDDWLNAFESQAVNMSSEQMQRLFGKMLAGEIHRPSTFSIRTVKLMGLMDIDVAQKFRKFCSMVCSYHGGPDNLIADGHAISLGWKTKTALHDFGLNNFDVGELEEYGLISSATPILSTYYPSIYRDDDSTSLKLPLNYNNDRYILIPERPLSIDDGKSYQALGIPLSRVGRELFGIVDIEENIDYTKALTAFFKDAGFDLHKIPDELE